MNFKKAQMTLFLLIGIVLVSAFMFINYLSTTTQTSQLPAESEKLVKDVLASGALQVLVTTCMEDAAKDGLELVGLQGGDIYTYQNGTALASTKAMATGCPDGYSGCKVGYGILMPPLENGTDYPPPPGYPGKNHVPELDLGKWGRFGKPDLRELCDSNGSNAPWTVTGNETIILPGGHELKSIFTPICFNNMYSENRSTQSQIEHFVKTKLESCVNWSEIRMRTGFNVTADSPEVRVRYGPSSVYIAADYPLTMASGGIEPVTRRSVFEANIPVRLKTIGEFASFMTSYDSYKLLFNVSTDYHFLAGWDSFINVSVTTPFRFMNIFDDVVTITDRGSNLAGKDYIYRFVRQNRIPALDYLTEENVYGDYDIVTLENKTVYFDPWGYDPDEDNVSYFYFGWKATYDEEFDFEQGAVVLKSGVPYNWTHSEPYLNTTRNASYATTHLDIGEHNMTIYACDEFLPVPMTPWAVEYDDGIVRPTEAGGMAFDDIASQLRDIHQNPLCDWQDLTIFIFDIPVLNASVSNRYDDIPNDFASIEDEFLLDASGTYSVYTVFNNMVWTDDLDDFRYEIPYDPTIAIAAIQLPQVPYNITHIKLASSYPPDSEMYFLTPGMHEINFTVDIPTAPVITKSVNVTKCLPHRNKDNPFPFPYHNYKPGGNDVYEPCDEATDPLCDQASPHYLSYGEAFQANHVCCSDGGTYFVDFKNPQQWDEVTIEHNLGALEGDLDVSVQSLFTLGVYDPSVVIVEQVIDDPNCAICYETFDEYTYEFEICKYLCQLKLPLWILTPDDFTPGPSYGRLKLTFNSPTPLGPVRVMVKDINADDEWGDYMHPLTPCFTPPPIFSGIFTMLEDTNDDVMAIPWYSGGGSTGEIYVENADGTNTNVGSISEIKGDLTNPYVNDIFRNERVRTCGTANPRGNVCGGPFTSSLYVNISCPDRDGDHGANARCQGAPNRTFDFDQEPDLNDCISADFDYPNTFEKFYGLSDASESWCNDVHKCSSPSTYDSSGGDYVARAGCGGGDCDVPLFKFVQGTDVSYVKNTASFNILPLKCSAQSGKDGNEWYCQGPSATTYDPGPYMTYVGFCDDDYAEQYGECKTQLKPLTDIPGMDVTDGQLIAEQCGDDVDFIENGECDFGSYDCPIIDYDFCGDQADEFISFNSITGQSVCCDGQGPDGALAYECSDYDGKCIDTPGPDGGALISENTQELCTDGIDNNCDSQSDGVSKVDQFDGDCDGIEDDDGFIMCGYNSHSVCINRMISAVGYTGTATESRAKGFMCLDDEFVLSVGDPVPPGICECGSSGSIDTPDLTNTAYICIPPKPASPALPEITILDGWVDSITTNDGSNTVLDDDFSFTHGSSDYSVGGVSYPSGSACAGSVNLYSDSLIVSNNQVEACILRINVLP